VKRIVVDALIIMAAAAGVILLLKKGGEAGVSKVKQVSTPVSTTVATAAPIRPQTIEGQLDNFNGPITLKPIRSWGTDPKHGFMLAISASPALNQPRARVAFTQPPAAPIVLEIQYTVAQNMFAMIEANSEARTKFDGVAVQVVTEGSTYNNSVLLNLDPLRRVDDRKWLSRNLIVPPGTKEVQFWIAGIPPRYSVSWASCVISLPQLRVASGKAAASPGVKRAATTQNR
jgi:hypothetical protein